MIFEYHLPIRRRTLPPFRINRPVEPIGPPASLGQLLALSHQLERRVRSGDVKDYEELARTCGVSPARIAQIVVLTQLATPIQDYVLFLSASRARLITEVELRTIAREICWDKQMKLFGELVARRS